MTNWTRRKLLQTGGAAGVTMALGRRAAAIVHGANYTGKSTGPLRLDLSGNRWTMHEEGTPDAIPATVPGCTFTDLMRAGKIPNPYYRENGGETLWVAERYWVYERSFEIPAALRAKSHVELVCHGLDTIATVWLNGRQLGQTENMFRTWRFDIKPHLHSGRNSIRIQFDPLTPYVEQRAWASAKWYGLFHHWKEAAYVRKAPYMWGWDFSCTLLTQGIWKDIEILAFDARLTDLNVVQHHQPNGAVQIEVRVEGTGELFGHQVRTRVFGGDQVVAESSGPVVNNAVLVNIAIHDPQLWWPNGMGDHPLYTVTAELIDTTGQVADTMTRRIGLRRVEVFPSENGVSKYVRLNGMPVFLKGADWAAPDSMPTQVTPDRLRWLVAKAAECNFNFFRLHGAEYYEENDFFDLCDELGIMLQFEFKFANDVYPVKDDEWMDNVRAEVEEQTRRCRNHASILIWSGNNEVQHFAGYDRLFDDLIGGVVHRLVPDAFYEAGSGGAAGTKLIEYQQNSLTRFRMTGTGDIHACRVWHLKAPFESYRDLQGFIAEVGIQAFPVPMSVGEYTDALDRTRIESPAMCYHERNTNGNGFGVIDYYDTLYFGEAPERVDDVLWLSQITQAYGLRYGIEYWRRSRPQSMATVVWQYNDCWPGVTWSMIDYYRRCKAVQYQAKHFFAPILVTGIPDPQTGRTDLYVVNDRRSGIAGTLSWVVTNLTGDVLLRHAKSIEVPACASQMAHTLDLSALAGVHGASNLLIWTEVIVDGRVEANNMLFFGRPLELKLPRPKLDVHVASLDRAFDVKIVADAPALWVWINLKDADAAYSDNFVHLRPGHPATIRISPERPMSLADFQRRLEVRSVYDLAPAMRRSQVS